MKILTDKEKEEVQFLDTALLNIENELKKYRNHIKALLADKAKLNDIRKRLIK